MAMKKIIRKYDGSAEFVIGDHYVNVKRLHARAVTGSTGQATEVGDRYIVTAGTLIPDSEGKPLGLCFRDVDVTDGDEMVAVVVHAVVDRTKLTQALTAAQEKALSGIIFISGEAPEAQPEDMPEYYTVSLPTVEHATITPEEGSRNIMPKGATYAFKIEAASGYHVTTATANGETLTADEDGVYSVEEIEEDITIAATVDADI